MEGRKAYTFKRLRLVHNFGLAAANLYFCIRLVRAALAVGAVQMPGLLCPQVKFDAANDHIAKAIWLVYLSKMVDWGDTFLCVGLQRVGGPSTAT